MITFSRAGEDNKSFKVTDIENTFAGFAGADYDLQVRAPGQDLISDIQLLLIEA